MAPRRNDGRKMRSLQRETKRGGDIVNGNYELFIHIGYPKTGTTFLQNEIYPNLSEICYIQRPLIREPIARLLRQDEFSFDYKKTRLELEAHLRRGKNIISKEGLVGNFFIHKAVTSKLIADRLSILFPDAKIIITIRNQYGMIESLYKQYVHTGGTKSLREFINFNGNKFEYSYTDWNLTVSPEMFNYLGLVEYYEKLFGRENILVIPFELLKKDPMQFVKRLFGWIGIDETPQFRNSRHNPGYGARQIAIARFLNRFLKCNWKETALIPDVSFPITGKIDVGKLRLILQSNLSRKLLGEKPITDETVKSGVKEMYAESNRLLDQKYELFLEEICPNEYF